MANAESDEILNDQVAGLVEAARRAGADAADAVVARSASTSVTVRLGKVESTDSSQNNGVSLRVFIGKRVASVSATSGFEVSALAERAVAMARVSPEDPYQGLADEKRLATTIRDLDLFDATDVSVDELTDCALAMEDAARAVGGVTNSGGASASAGFGGFVLATSSGFHGGYRGSRFSRSVSVLAGEGTAMERDYDFSSRLYYRDLEPAETIGRSAGERAVRRLGAKKMKTGPVNVIFDPRVARGLAGTLGSAINGASVARKTSFLRDRMGEQVAAKGITLTDDPQRVRGSASRPFDGEGVAGDPLTMIEDGVLKHWFLSTATARELGLETNGRGVRSGSSVSPSSTNLAVEPGNMSPEELIAGLGDGLYVTEMIGQGVDMVTGDFSRGASGFRIEKGQITTPVSEVTIASNLKEMFINMTAADDLDRDYGTAAPTLMVEGMTLAGE